MHEMIDPRHNTAVTIVGCDTNAIPKFAVRRHSCRAPVIRRRSTLNCWDAVCCVADVLVLDNKYELDLHTWVQRLTDVAHYRISLHQQITASGADMNPPTHRRPMLTWCQVSRVCWHGVIVPGEVYPSPTPLHQVVTSLPNV